jgi:hypothetical protein
MIATSANPDFDPREFIMVTRHASALLWLQMSFNLTILCMLHFLLSCHLRATLPDHIVVLEFVRVQCTIDHGKRLAE